MGAPKSSCWSGHHQMLRTPLVRCMYQLRNNAQIAWEMRFKISILRLCKTKWKKRVRDNTCFIFCQNPTPSTVCNKPDLVESEADVVPLCQPLYWSTLLLILQSVKSLLHSGDISTVLKMFHSEDLTNSQKCTGRNLCRGFRLTLNLHGYTNFRHTREEFSMELWRVYRRYILYCRNRDCWKDWVKFLRWITSPLIYQHSIFKRFSKS